MLQIKFSDGCLLKLYLNMCRVLKIVTQLVKHEMKITKKKYFMSILTGVYQFWEHRNLRTQSKVSTTLYMPVTFLQLSEGFFCGVSLSTFVLEAFSFIVSVIISFTSV